MDRLFNIKSFHFIWGVLVYDELKKNTLYFFLIILSGTGPSTYLPPYTTRRPYVTTRRPGSNIGAIIPAIGGGVLLLALLAGGAAALASSTG